MASPSFTVVIPSKDRLSFVLDVVENVLLELHDNDRLVIVDDGSHTPIESILAQNLKTMATKLSIIRNETPKGPAAARNIGVKQSETDLVVFLDDDDLFAPGYLDRLRQFWADHPEVDFGFCRNSGADPEDAVFKEMQPPWTKRDLFPLSLGVWVKRDVFFALGGLVEELITNEDTEFAIHLLKQGKNGVVLEGRGVLVNAFEHVSGDNTMAHAASITRLTNAAKRSDCFAEILIRHREFLETEQGAQLRHFCLSRLIDLRAKANGTEALPSAIGYGMAACERWRWRTYFLMRKVLRRFGSRKVI